LKRWGGALEALRQSAMAAPLRGPADIAFPVVEIDCRLSPNDKFRVFRDFHGLDHHTLAAAGLFGSEQIFREYRVDVGRP
jgi:hypothetical protein